MSGFNCAFSGRREVKRHRVPHLVKQPAADVSQSPNRNRDATVGTNKAAFLLPTDLLLRETQRREKWKRLKGRYSSNVCASVLSFSEGLKAVLKINFKKSITLRQVDDTMGLHAFKVTVPKLQHFALGDTKLKQRI